MIIRKSWYHFAMSDQKKPAKAVSLKPKKPTPQPPAPNTADDSNPPPPPIPPDGPPDGNG